MRLVVLMRTAVRKAVSLFNSPLVPGYLDFKLAFLYSLLHFALPAHQGPPMLSQRNEM